MSVTEMPLKVGKRALDDRVQIELPGTLIKPATRSEVVLLFETGLDGHREDYREFFGGLLGNEFNMYIGEIRRRGWLSVERSLDDVLQVDLQLRDRLETNKVFYVGHSMGMNIAAASQDVHDTHVEGLYGICAYPSFGDTRTRDEDLKSKGFQQKVIDGLVKMLFLKNIGPLAHSLNSTEIDAPVRFAIGGSDEVTNTRYQETAERFRRFFATRYSSSSSKIFPGKNHCFNHGYRDWAPFNKDDPQPLVDDIIAFVYHTLEK